MAATHLISGNEPHVVAVPTSAVLPPSPTSKSSDEVCKDKTHSKMAVVESQPKERMSQKSSPSDNTVMKHLRENPYVLGLAAVRESDPGTFISNYRFCS